MQKTSKTLERIKCNKCGSDLLGVKELKTFLLLTCKECGGQYMLDKKCFMGDEVKWGFEK